MILYMACKYIHDIYFDNDSVHNQQGEYTLKEKCHFPIKLKYETPKATDSLSAGIRL